MASVNRHETGQAGRPAEKGVERASEWAGERKGPPTDRLEEAAREVGLTAAEAANSPGESACDTGEPVG
jgi:hypothetical protein